MELQTVAFPEAPPPSYETVMAAAQTSALEAPYVPPRYLAPTEGRNSIRYSDLLSTKYTRVVSYNGDNSE